LSEIPTVSSEFIEENKNLGQFNPKSNKRGTNLMNIPEDVDKRYKNRKIQEQKITEEKFSKLERQKQAYTLHLQGYQNNEIAEKLSVSLSTIEKDLHEIREDARNWFKEISKNGLGRSLVDAFLQIDESQKELWRLYRTGKDEAKPKILNEIVNASVKKKELFWASGQKPSWLGFGE